MITLYKPTLNSTITTPIGDMKITDPTAVVIYTPNNMLLVDKEDFDREGITEDELFNFTEDQLLEFSVKTSRYYYHMLMEE